MNVDLFQNTVLEASFMLKEAVISDCTFYRYELRRIWDTGKPMLVVCMLNPSTADSSINDPTVLTLIHFGKLWGYGGLLIVNLYGFRSSSPAEMFSKGAAAIGPLNEKYTFAAIKYAKENGGKLLAAWGNGGHEKAIFFAERVTCAGVELICLGTTQSGAPKHPLARGKHRIPRDQMPIVWRTAA
jgi:hypothetical protein